MRFNKEKKYAYIHRIENKPSKTPVTLAFEHVCGEPITEMIINNWDFSDYVENNICSDIKEVMDEATSDYFGGIDLYAEINGKRCGINSKGSTGGKIHIKNGDAQHIMNGEVQYLAIIRYVTGKLYLIDCDALLHSNYWSHNYEFDLTMSQCELLPHIIFNIDSELCDYYERCYTIKEKYNKNKDIFPAYKAISELYDEFSQTFGYTIYPINCNADVNEKLCVLIN